MYHARKTIARAADMGSTGVRERALHFVQGEIPRDPAVMDEQLQRQKAWRDRSAKTRGASMLDA